ncbi:membrane protein [Bacteroidia bacterium]|nr:membrane protein [Bacteroidia bacterium]
MKKILISMLSLILLTSCHDMLDLNPLDRISASTFWMKKEDFDMALTSIYSMRQGSSAMGETGMWSSGMGFWDCLTDLGHSVLSSEIVSGSISPSTRSYISDVYQNCYAGITRINLFLRELYKYQGSDFPEFEKKEIEAEARFHRAFYYFQLYNCYGDVPLILENLTVETMRQPKVDAELVFDQVLRDIDFAIANLNRAAYRTITGHATLASAQVLKARMLICKAYGNTGIPDIDMLTQVRDLCLDIEGTGYYQLSPVFSDLFQTKGQLENKEIIFSVNFMAPNNCTGWDLSYGDWIAASPLPSFVADFECTDGLPWGESPLTNLDNPMLNRDPRLAATVFTGLIDFGNGKTHIPVHSFTTGYGIKKFLDPDNLPYGYQTLSGQDAVVSRLSEVLLMYAEAQNEISGPDTTVYEAINKIRARVNMPPLPKGLTKSQMREKIRHERKIELAFEGVRYFDLKRWHIAGKVLNAVTDGIHKYLWEDRYYKWPIPQFEIDVSKGVLLQNPDYLYTSINN